MMAIDSESHHLQVGKIPIIDLRFLSQEDLNSLGRCSDQFQPLRCDDIVVPKIDRSVFNESAGSRKQTYSRLRPARRKEDVGGTVGRRRTRILSVSSRSTSESVDEQRENNQIVLLLRQLFARDKTPWRQNHKTGPVPQVTDNSNNNNNNINASNGGALSVVQSLPTTTEPQAVFCQSVVVVDASSTERPRKRVRKKDDARRKKLLVPCDSYSVFDDDDDHHSNEVEEGGSCYALVVHHDNDNDNENRCLSVGDEVEDQQINNIDPSFLASEDPFLLELRRRTAGLENEAQLLQFLQNLQGKWGSRRKKRKIVDACDFAKGLPKGWKLLLGVRKKEGRYSLDCRRYISPDGQQFKSCKEVSLHLMSSIHPHGSNQIFSNNKVGSTHRAFDPAATRTAGAVYEHDNTREDPTKHSLMPFSSISTDIEKQIVLFKVENPVKAQLMNLLECRRCSLSFGNKDAYVQHLLSFHQRNAKRCRPGKSIGEGVIIKDGKYVCQICHKVFEEKHRYNGHVGVHVRNFVKSLEALPDEVIVEKSLDPSPLTWTPLVGSEVEDLVDNGVNTILEATAKSDHEQTVGSSLGEKDSIVEDKVDCSLESGVLFEVAGETLASKSGDEHSTSFEMVPPDKIGNALTSNAGNAELDVLLDAEISLSANLQSGTCESSINKESFPDNGENFPSITMVRMLDNFGNERESGFGDCSIIQCTSNQNDGFGTCINDIFMDHAVHNKGDKSSNAQEITFEGDHVETNNGTIVETIESIIVDGQENVVQNEVGDTPELVQPSEGCPTLSMISEKGEDELSVSHKLDNMSGFDELRLDDIGPSRFDFVTTQASSSLPEEPADLAYGVDLEQEINPSVWDSILPKLDDSHQLTTVCVWCRMEFNHEGIHSETQSDSVGFMCPTCKAKISGQLSVLDNGLSVNADQL